MKSNLLILLLFIVAIFPGCKEKKADSNDNPDSKLVIGVSMLSLSNEYVVILHNELRKAAKSKNIELIITDAQRSADRQVQQVESFISQGVDAIILNPCEFDASAPAVDKAKAAKIPIVNVNSETRSQPDAFVGSRDEEAAELAMEYIAKRMNSSGNVAMMEGYMGQAAQIRRSAGGKNVLSKYPGVKIITQQTADWDRAKGMALMENWMQVHKKSLNAVFAQNDEMAMGALQAAEQAGMKDKIIIVGIDAIMDALYAVKQRRLDATVFQDAKGQAEKAIEMAYKLIRNEPIAEKNIFIPFKLVTYENVKQFLKE